MGLLAELEGYADACLDGRIFAEWNKKHCIKHQWAALRFKKDLARRSSWRWDFDEDRAEKYFSFMSLCKHRRGPLAGQEKVPEDYELFVYGNIYGWIDAETENRRFRRMYEQLARKNAKSQDKAIQSLFEISLFGESGAEAYVAATKKEQTRFVWGEAKWLFENSPLLKDKFSCKYDQELLQQVIKHKKSGSFFSRLSKDDGKKGDGANPHFGILDEYHLQDTTEYYDLFTSGMKTRSNPLLSIITTAGFELNNPCYRVEYDYVSKILDPDNPIENDRYFAMICELDRNDTGEKLITEDGREIEPDGIIDDMDDDETIFKVSPVTGGCPTVIENIRIEVNEAKDKPEKRRDVLTKTFNIWVNQRAAGYMNLSKWSACKVPNIIELINTKTKKRGYVGFDMSAKIDLASVGFDFPGTDDNYYVMSHSFMPEETYLAHLASDKVPYDVWRDKGYLTVTPGAVIDYRALMKYALDTFKANGWFIAECCLDPWGAIQISADLTANGKTCVEVVQGYKTLSEPTKNFREMAYSGRLKHSGNPLLTWAAGNAVLRKVNDNIMIDKDKSIQRIDPLACLITAHTRAMTRKPSGGGRVIVI